jgi:hypothetical protein
MNKQKVIVYVDGFNLYYGLKKNLRWRRYYWLDVVKFFEMFMKPNQELLCVKYFSAKPDNLDKALRRDGKVSIHARGEKHNCMFLGCDNPEEEAKEDFFECRDEMIELDQESGKALPEFEFEFAYDTD